MHSSFSLSLSLCLWQIFHLSPTKDKWYSCIKATRKGTSCCGRDRHCWLIMTHELIDNDSDHDELDMMYQSIAFFLSSTISLMSRCSGCIDRGSRVKVISPTIFSSSFMLTGGRADAVRGQCMLAERNHVDICAAVCVYVFVACD